MKSRWGTILYLLPYVLIAQASIMSSARTEEADTIASTEKAASVLILGMNGETWDRALIWSLIAAAIAAVFVGLTTAGSIITHKREAEAAEASLERYKETVAGKVAEAKSEGIRAGETAGNALERAGRLEKEAADARERAADFELQLAKIKAPRSLDDAQVVAIKAACAQFPGTKFDMAITSGDPEAEQFELVIENTLKAAGWQHMPWTGYGMNRSRPGGEQFGEYTASNILLFVHVDMVEQLGGPATALVRTLEAAGIAVAAGSDNWASEGEHSNPLNKENIHIVVGRKSP